MRLWLVALSILVPQAPAKPQGPAKPRGITVGIEMRNGAKR